MRPPTISGPGGRAWKLEINPLKLLTLDQTAGVCGWLLNVPGAHPFWSFWTLSLISLRDIPGVRPAVLRYPSAEFEIIISAINPERCPSPDPDRHHEGYPYLLPLDLEYQFDGVPEDVADEIAGLCVDAIMAGRLSPDQDYRAIWKDTLDATVDHYKKGLHS